MGEINADTVRAAISDTDPVLEALSVLLREIATDAVRNMASVLAMTGTDPRTLPGSYFIQSMLVEGEKVFEHITRDDWIKIYDAYAKIKAIVDANPDIQAQLRARRAEQGNAVLPGTTSDSLLDGDF